MNKEKKGKKAKKAWGPKDYCRVGPVYVRKKWVLAALCALSLLVLGVWGMPFASGRFSGDLPPVYRWNDPALRRLSGRVRVEDSAGRIRYEGEVEQGAFTGQGKVYDVQGQLCYEGPLVDGVYEGSHARVYRNGQLLYEGEMAAGLYQGQGRRVDPDTGVVSQGQFQKGQLWGEGKELDAQGRLLREGVFVQDFLQGQGREYSSQGQLCREGEFFQGMLWGEGKEYDPEGNLRYEGQFVKGVCQGSGKLYDTQHGTLRFQGEFSQGQPMGMGKLYHQSGQLLYEGQVYGLRPRADAFLGLSLAEVEQAFSQHWQIYMWEGTAAFVYPTFHLMFLTQSPVPLIPAEEGEVLSPQADKSAILITQVLSYGQILEGTPQPEEGDEGLDTQEVWPWWFSQYALTGKVQGVQVEQTGQFICRFTPKPGAAQGEKGKEALAEDGVLETAIGYTGDKEGSVFYQRARWKEERE